MIYATTFSIFSEKLIQYHSSVMHNCALFAIGIAKQFSAISPTQFYDITKESAMQSFVEKKLNAVALIELFGQMTSKLSPACHTWEGHLAIID